MELELLKRVFLGNDERPFKTVLKRRATSRAVLVALVALVPCVLGCKPPDSGAVEAGRNDDEREMSDAEALDMLELDDVSGASGHREGSGTDAPAPSDGNVLNLASNRTPEEEGLMSLGLYNPDVGAFRSLVPYDGYYRYWTGDNALVLSALAQPRYAALRAEGVGNRLRDYLISSAQGGGQFSEGLREHPTTRLRTDTPLKCSPAIETQVLSGIVLYTAAHGAEGGARAGKAVKEFISKNVKAQHRRVLEGQKGNSIPSTPEDPVPQCPGENHNFTNPYTIAYHIMNSSVWAKRGGDGRQSHASNAREAFELLVKKTDGDGLFSGGALRNSQILYALTRASQHGFRHPDLTPLLARLVKSGRRAGNGGLHFSASKKRAGNGSRDTQSLSYFLLAFKKKPPLLGAFGANRYCGKKGIQFKGHFTGPAPGPVEDQGAGAYASAHAAARRWPLPSLACP